MQTWEQLRFQSVIVEGPEIQPITYDFEQILGVEYDGSNMTGETCGLAVVDDQQSLITDVILEKGIEAVTDIAGAIQRKEKHVRQCVVAYDMYCTKSNAEKQMRATLGDPYKNAWDSWPERAWKCDDDSVELVQAHIQKEKRQRTQGIFGCVWSSVRSMVSGSRQGTSPMEVKEEEQESLVPAINKPTFFTGELPRNSVMEMSCFNRQDQEPLVEALKKPPPGYEEEPGSKRVMAFKCPG